MNKFTKLKAIHNITKVFTRLFFDGFNEQIYKIESNSQLRVVHYAHLRRWF